MSRLCLLLSLVCFLPSLAAQTPVVVRGPYLQQGTPTSVILRWRTDIACDSVVNHGAAPGTLFANTSDSTLTTEHTITVQGLTPDSIVFYSIAATGFGVLVGDDADHFFKTAPPAGVAKPTRIWVLGDSGTADNNARRVRDSYYDFQGTGYTDLMLLLGDNAYNTGLDSEFQFAMFENMYEDKLRQTVVWPAYGNHDAITADASTQSGPYYDIFNLPTAGESGGLASGTEAYYSFDYGNIHFVVLDSEESDRSVGGAMATWLQADLAANTLKWTIAYWHHPPYSKGSHDSDTEARLVQMRQNFLPILENEGVDLVLGGHSHAYERSYFISGHYGDSMTYNAATHALSPSKGRVGLDGGYEKRPNSTGAYDGCVYVVAGASGKISGGTFDHPTSVISFPVLGSVVIDVDGDQLDARYFTSEGLLFDFFSITKSGVTPLQRTHLPILTSQFWKYDDNGIDLGTAWRQPGFDDSSWSSGMAPLGYGEPWITTLLSQGPSGTNSNPTTYLRREFNVDLDPADVEHFLFAALYDDGFVAYLNGVEVARSPSMPGGPISYGTLSGNHEAVAYEKFDLQAFASLLVPGQNVFAVEIHQTSPTSSDLVFDGALYIDGVRSFLGPSAVGSVVDAQGQPESPFTINGSDGGFGRSVDVRVGEPFSFEMQPPSTLASGIAPFTIFGYFGTPSASESFLLPAPVGEMAFPPAFPGVPAPLSFLVGDNLLGLPGALAFTTPAPWSAVNPGLGFPGVYTFHGWIITSPGVAQTFNAIRMNVTP